MTAVVVTIIYALFAVFEIVSLVKTRHKKELFAFCALMFVAYVISILLVFGVKIPSFERLIGDLIIPLTGN